MPDFTHHIILFISNGLSNYQQHYNVANRRSSGLFCICTFVCFCGKGKVKCDSGETTQCRNFKVFKSFESASTSNFLSYYSFNEGFIIPFNEDATLIKILGNPTILEYDINLPKEKNNKNGK